LISFQSLVYWFHFNQNGYIWTYNSVITHYINSILKRIDAYVTMVPWFPFNPQYTGFISTKMVTYEYIIQSSYQFNDAQPYMYNSSQYWTIFLIYQAINIKVYAIYIINQYQSLYCQEFTNLVKYSTFAITLENSNLLYSYK